MPRSNRRLALAAVVLLLGALAALLWMRRSSQQSSTSERADPGKHIVPRAPIRLGATDAPSQLPVPARQAPVRLSAATISQDSSVANGEFSGRVVNWGNGKGVAGAEIVFSGTSGAVTITSTMDGSFRFLPPAIGRYRLAVASAYGFLPYAPRWGRSPIELFARANQRVDGLILYMTPALTYRGRVLGEDKQPVAGATVRLLGADRGERALVSIKDTFKTNARGEFDFSAPDGAVLEATHADHEPGRGRVDRTVQVTHKMTIELGRGAGVAAGPHRARRDAREGTASLEGRVVSDAGSPVGAFTIAVLIKQGLTERVVKYTSVFDARGRFRVRGLEPREYVLRAVGYGYAPSAGVNATASESGGSNVTVTLLRGGTLTGKVVGSESKQPLEAAKVSVEGTMGSGTSALPMVASAVTDERGEFELAGLPAGRASVITAAYNHHSRIVSRLTVTPGGTIGPLTIELTPVKQGEAPKLELAGIGAALGAKDTGLEIQRIFPGSGAGAAGLVVGDVITGVDGKAITELGFQGAIQAIRGPVGTTVRLTVRRGNGETTDVITTRRKIRA